MNLSIPDRAIKLLIVSLIWPAALPGCTPVMVEAPFAAAEGTIRAGDLRGPFSGRVLDAGSGKPIAGATVLASWLFEAGAGLHSPAAAMHRVVATDADGRYLVPRLLAHRRARLVRATLIIYQRSYVAYRSDFRYEDFSPRSDFVQLGHEVRLERFPSSGSHVRHLRYVGVGGPLAAVTAWERQLAADEALQRTQQHAAAGTGEGGGEAEAAAQARPSLDAGRLLTADELKAVTGYKGQFSVAKLGDRVTSASYDSVHFRAVDKPEKFDAAIRVFRAESSTAAEDQFGELARDYPAVEQRNEVGDRSLRATEGEILALVALDRTQRLVVVLTCGVAQCHDADTVAGLMRRMWPRLGRVTAAQEQAKELNP